MLALISVSLTLSQTPATLWDHGYGASVSCMCLFTPQLSSLVLIAPTHGWMARLSWPGWLVTRRDGLPTSPQTVTHRSTNRARHRITSLIMTNAWTTTPRRHQNILLVQHSAEFFEFFGAVTVPVDVEVSLSGGGCTRCLLSVMVTGLLCLHRFYKLHTKGFCEVIPMTVPRKVDCSSMSVCMSVCLSQLMTLLWWIVIGMGTCFNIRYPSTR